MIDINTQKEIVKLNILMGEKRIANRIINSVYVIFIFLFYFSFKIFDNTNAIFIWFGICIFSIIFSSLSPSKESIKGRYKTIQYYGLDNVYYDGKTSSLMIISNNLKTTTFYTHEYSDQKHYIMSVIIKSHIDKHKTYKQYLDSIKPKYKSKYTSKDLNFEN